MAMFQEHTVFIASQGDTEPDRQLVPALVEEIDSSFAPEGQRLCVSRWERDRPRSHLCRCLRKAARPINTATWRPRVHNSTSFGPDQPAIVLLFVPP
jgi:hypothetical protein